MLVMMQRSSLQSNYSNQVVQGFSNTICNNVRVVVAKTLAGSGNRYGRKGVKVQAVARLFPAEKRQTVMLGEIISWESFCISDDFERYLCVNGVSVRGWKVYIYIIMRVHCLGDPPPLY